MIYVAIGILSAACFLWIGKYDKKDREFWIVVALISLFLWPVLIPVFICCLIAGVVATYGPKLIEWIGSKYHD